MKRRVISTFTVPAPAPSTVHDASLKAWLSTPLTGQPNTPTTGGSETVMPGDPRLG